MNSSKAFNKIAKYKMDKIQESPHIGCWKILCFDLVDSPKQFRISTSSDNIKFELKANDFLLENSTENSSSDEAESEDFSLGEITWHILPNNTFNDTIRPIFECNTFEYDSSQGIIEMSSSNLNFEFEVSFEPLEPNEKENKISTMVLSNEQGNFKLICQRVMAIENFDKQYDFGDMMNNEFMSDVIIKAASGQCFYAHKTILSLTLKGKTENFVKDLNELRNEPELIELILFYLYNNSLSNKIEISDNKTLQDKKLECLVKFLQKYSELDEFALILKTFLDNNSFKEVFNLLINDVKKCSELLNARIKYNESINNNNHLFSDPAKLVQILKFCLNQISLAFIKIIRLLDLFAGKQNQLSKKEKIEFISQIENCFPFFVEQFKQLLVSLHKHSQQSTEQNKREVAEYLVPELDKFVDNMLNLIECWEDIIEKLISNKKSKNSKSTRKNSDEEEDDQEEVSSQKYGKKLKIKLGKSIKTAMHVRELKKIQKFSVVIKKKISKLESSLKKYQKTQQNSKANLILKELNNITNNFINDTPTFLVKLDNFLAKVKARSKNSSKQKEFRYSLKITSSRIQWMLNELRQNNVISDSLLSQLISKVNLREFTSEIEKLGLGKSKPIEKNPDSKLNLESCFQPKSINENHLSIEALKLFKSKYLSDIVINVIDDQKNSAYFHVHGVLVASRCAWFHRALSSGMKESINKKVVLYDSNLKLFEMFIEYLYSGHFDSDYQLDNTELIGLLTLADKYECNSLKYLIEQRLINSLESFSKISDNHDWILDLIDIIILSEQFNLKNLMNTSVDILTEMMKENDVNSNREEFKQLNENLVKKIDEKLSSKSHKKKKTICKSSKKKILDEIFYESSSDDDIVFGDSYDNVRPLYSDISITREQQLINYAHPLIVADPHLLEDTFNQLKEIIGPDIDIQFNDQELVKLLVQNDYDLNRVVPVVLNCE